MRDRYRIKAVNKDEVFPAVHAVTEAGSGVSVSFQGRGRPFRRRTVPA